MRWLLAMAVIGGCGGGEEPAPSGPTWHGDIDGVLAESCGSCHQSGGIGPMALDDYGTAAEWADAIALAVSERTMPPWLATGDGSCGEFSDSRWLEQETIDRIVAWAEAGAPEGDPSIGTAAPPAVPTLDRIDQTLTTPLFTPVAVGTPEARNDEYRCFLFDDPTPEDTLLVGYEVLPGNVAIDHHLIGMVVDPAAVGYDGQPNAVHIAAMNGADGRDGWPCFGAAGGAIQTKGAPIVWGPGLGVVAFPEGSGIAIDDADVLVVQIHYNLVDPATVGQTDSTVIRLKTQTDGIREAYMSLPDLFLNSLFEGDPQLIPAGEAAYPVTFSLPGWQLAAAAGVPNSQWNSPFNLLGVGPHMHLRGKEQHVKVIRADSSEDCVVDVDRWDFHWQLLYFYEEPLVVQPNDEVEITCVFDTSADSAPIGPGWGTDSEMCLATLVVQP